jgi:cytochrome c-type biogenesis protein CcmH/NrfF
MIYLLKAISKVTFSFLLAISIYFLFPLLYYLPLLTPYSLLPTPYSATFAQEPDYDRINEIAKNLNCPTCAGLNLADCNTLTCAQWRDQISDLIKQGYSDKDVLDYFSNRYGSQVLQEPPKSGMTLFLWVLPLLVLLSGGAWLILALRSWAKPEPAMTMAAVRPVSNVVSPPNQYLSQVDKDLNLEEQ